MSRQFIKSKEANEYIYRRSAGSEERKLMSVIKKIGQYLSAIANAAALHRKESGWLYPGLAKGLRTILFAGGTGPL